MKDGDKILDIGSSTKYLKNRLLNVCGRKVFYKNMDIDRETEQDYYSLDEIDEKLNVIFLFEVVEHLTFEDGIPIFFKLE